MTFAVPDLPVYGPDWRLGALCAQVGGDVWFPAKGEPTRGAKDVCRRCPVAAQCLDYALDNDLQAGIWGGLSLNERRRLPDRPTTRECDTDGCDTQVVRATTKRYCDPCATARHRQQAKASHHRTRGNRRAA